MLAQSTAVIRHDRIKIREYCTQFANQPILASLHNIGLLGVESPAISGVLHSINAFSRANQAQLLDGMNGHELLATFSLYSPAPIRRSLLMASQIDASPGAGAVLGLFPSWSLASWNSGTESITLNDITTTASRENLSPSEVREATSAAIRMIRNANWLPEGAWHSGPPTQDGRYAASLAAALWSNACELDIGDDLLVELGELRLSVAKFEFADGNFQTSLNIGTAVASALDKIQSERADLVAIATSTHAAHCLLALGEKSSAITAYRSLAEKTSATHGHLSPLHIETILGLANTYRSAGQANNAVRVLEGLIKGTRIAQDLPSTVQAEIFGSLGFAYLVNNNPLKAIPLLERSVSIRRKTLGERALMTLAVQTNLGRAYLEVMDPRASATIEETFQAKVESLGCDHPQTLVSMHYYAISLISRGEFDDGMSLLLDTLKARIKRLGESHPDTQLTANVVRSFTDVEPL
ncbi:tetratricopeptide repeat protein [Promicromonospora sukumoe]|uniref:Tetratricopeptide repeat protein n=1 Tax=Promicromonospora sukumoe TaxID=88382 RepID=A0A7W3J512_9MICO|nr:tetratricopeptide repeat protein [Promicromonospora sukumoe]MBA8806347.1 hypothetical protein [Promicromonospora sukumoe]